MKKSVTQLCRDIKKRTGQYISNQELNIILRNKEYQSGEPGNYEPTAKGLPYVEQHENHHGTGGYSNMNVYYTTTRWDDSILDDEEITAEDISNARLELSERRKQKREQRKTASESYGTEYNSDSDTYIDEDHASDSESSVMNLVYIATVVGLGIYTGIKFAVSSWNEKVAPKIASTAQNKKCPKCDRKMRYDKNQNCWICKKCGAVKQETNEAPSE